MKTGVQGNIPGASPSGLLAAATCRTGMIFKRTSTCPFEMSADLQPGTENENGTPGLKEVMSRPPQLGEYNSAIVAGVLPLVE